MDNYFPEWKAIRSSKTKRIAPSGVSIPVKLYYERKERIKEDFLEVDNADTPKEWQSERIIMDTGRNEDIKE